MTRSVEVSAGTIAYEDTGGAGPAIVLLPGLMMDASLWQDVIADLSPDHRCIAPTLPMGAHRQPMRADADLSPRGLARLVSELLDRLDLNDVTLVGNDTGGALVQLLACDAPARVGRIVLVSCDAFDNFPPGLTGKTLALTGKLSPTMFGLFMQQMRLRPLRRLPLAFGWLTMRGDAATARWIKPVLEQSEIRRDTVRVLREIAAQRHLLRRHRSSPARRGCRAALQAGLATAEPARYPTLPPPPSGVVGEVRRWQAVDARRATSLASRTTCSRAWA